MLDWCVPGSASLPMPRSGTSAHMIRVAPLFRIVSSAESQPYAPKSSSVFWPAACSRTSLPRPKQRPLGYQRRFLKAVGVGIMQKDTLTVTLAVIGQKRIRPLKTRCSQFELIQQCLAAHGLLGSLQRCAYIRSACDPVDWCR